MSKIAVIMSVYNNDKYDDIYQSLYSLINQTYKNFDIFLQVDGVVSNNVESLILELSEKYKFIYPEFVDSNYGLAWQLNRAIYRASNNNNKYDYIARMDADDISHANRFEVQLDYLNKNHEISVLGSSVIEFDNNGYRYEKIMSSDHEVLLKNIIKRCPLNHPTVIFNLSRIRLSDINYNSTLKNTQDYYLWVELLNKGYIFSNVSEPLLDFRVDENFHSRRGFKKAINDVNSRVFALKMLKNHSVTNISHIILLFLLRISPSYLKKLAYSFLR